MLSRSPEAHSLLQQQCDEQLRLGGEEKRGGVGPEPLDRHLTSNCFHLILFLTATFQRRQIVFRTAGGSKRFSTILPFSLSSPPVPIPKAGYSVTHVFAHFWKQKTHQLQAARAGLAHLSCFHRVRVESEDFVGVG